MAGYRYTVVFSLYDHLDERPPQMEANFPTFQL